MPIAERIAGLLKQRGGSNPWKRFQLYKTEMTVESSKKGGTRSGLRAAAGR